MPKSWNSTRLMSVKHSLTKGRGADHHLTTRRCVCISSMPLNMMDITKHDWLPAGISLRHPSIPFTPAWCHYMGFEFSPSSLSSTTVNYGPRISVMPTLNHSPRKRHSLLQDLSSGNEKDMLSSSPRLFMDCAAAVYAGHNGWQMCFATWVSSLPRPNLTHG